MDNGTGSLRMAQLAIIGMDNRGLQWPMIENYPSARVIIILFWGRGIDRLSAAPRKRILSLYEESV